MLCAVNFTTMRNDIIEILEKLSKGEKPFFEQDNLPKEMQNKCSKQLKKTKNLETLNRFFEDEISHIIFHSHNMYLAYR
jgi:hypothetical protein